MTRGYVEVMPMYNITVTTQSHRKTTDQSFNVLSAPSSGQAYKPKTNILSFWSSPTYSRPIPEVRPLNEHSSFAHTLNEINLFIRPPFKKEGKITSPNLQPLWRDIVFILLELCCLQSYLQAFYWLIRSQRSCRKSLAYSTNELYFPLGPSSVHAANLVYALCCTSRWMRASAKWLECNNVIEDWLVWNW